jgi:hypothetical protein
MSGTNMSMSQEKGIQEVFRAAASYGYWMGSPEENAAIGLGLK